MNSNQLPSEQYRIAAKAWVEKEKAAKMLEECKTATLSQRMNNLGEMPTSKAERLVKGSKEWREYLTELVEARAEANLAKVKLKYLEMKYFEWQSGNANNRAEMRMSNQ